MATWCDELKPHERGARTDRPGRTMAYTSPTKPYLYSRPYRHGPRPNGLRALETGRRRNRGPTSDTGVLARIGDTQPAARAYRARTRSSSPPAVERNIGDTQICGSLIHQQTRETALLTSNLRRSCLMCRLGAAVNS